MKDLFRHHQNKLTQRPSARSWDRLERRLEQHQQGVRTEVGHVRIFRQFGMAATVLLLLTTAVLLALAGWGTRNQYAPIADSQIEYLNVSPSEQGLRQLRQYQVRLYTAPKFSNERVQPKKTLQLSKGGMQ
ncbi:MAG: hypothetical protein AAGK47_09070 [Bacteroidota bacterium]